VKEFHFFLLAFSFQLSASSFFVRKQNIAVSTAEWLEASGWQLEAAF
jgi:hypothetical protein